MFKIKKSLYDYITVSQLKEFLKENDIEFKSTISKVDLLERIKSEVDNGMLNASAVNQWLNNVVEIGAKHVYFSEIEKSENGNWIINNSSLGYYNTSILSNTIHEVYRKKEVVNNENIYSYGLGIGLFYESTPNIASRYYLPIKIEFNADRCHLFISFRPNNRLYFLNSMKSEDKTTEVRLMNEITKYIEKTLNLSFKSDNTKKDKLRNTVYRILEESSKLPAAIQSILDSYDACDLNAFLENTKSNYSIKQGFHRSIEEDVMNIIEKYICLNWDVQDDFTKGQRCYPYNIALKDCENTTLIQKSSLNESLLTRSAYHDNKKTLKQEKMCESIHMAYDIGGRKCKVIYSVEKFKGKIAFEKYLSMEKMDEIVDNFVQKYYE